MLTLSTRAFTRPVLHLPKQPLRFWKKTLLTLDILTPSYQTTLQPLALQSSRNDVITARGIKHLTGAPYHPATNGAAKRLVQSFKQSMKKSKLPPRPALQEFLMQYRRTPLNTGFSPSQLLNGRQIRTVIDSLLPSPAHIAQERQATDATKSQQKEHSTVQHVRTRYSVGTPCYALYCGPRHKKLTKMGAATVTKVHGTRSFTVKVHPRGPLWKPLKMPTLVSTMEIGLHLVLPLHRMMDQPPSPLPTKPTNRRFQNTEGTIHGDLDETGSHVTLVT